MAGTDPANEGAVALETFSLGGGVSEACLPVDPDASRRSSGMCRGGCPLDFTPALCKHDLGVKGQTPQSEEFVWVF